LARVRKLILVTLLILAAVSWALLIWQVAIVQQPMMGLTMGLGAPLFLAIWVVMMAAMMFPTAAPMILMFARVHMDKRARGQPFVPTWIFVSGYMSIWALFGLLAYVVAIGVQTFAQQSMWLMDNAARFGGATLILAGLYQLSPFKRSCLSHCRTPLDFLLTAWREGYGGAFRMGLEHGLFCLGCCWMLFVIFFPLGLMNIAAMAVITLLIFAEKSMSLGPRLAQLAAIVLIVYGILIVLMPHLLPMAVPPPMPM
jgi:predicted metal-binding membrane protein